MCTACLNGSRGMIEAVTLSNLFIIESLLLLLLQVALLVMFIHFFITLTFVYNKIHFEIANTSHVDKRKVALKFIQLLGICA